MNTFSNAFRAEVVRMARKELKPELQGMRKAATRHRSEIAALKREVKSLASQLKTAQRQVKLADTVQVAAKEPSPVPSKKPSFEFRAEVLSQMRATLRITQAELASLLGASKASVYKWESGRVHPRAAQLARIEEVLKMGPRKALAALAKA